MRGITNNLDFLAARLHGRRGRMAAGERLAALGQLRSLPRLAAEVLAGVTTESAAEIQQRLQQELARETAAIAAQLASPGAKLLEWLVIRFQLENLKVLLRGMLTDRGEASRGSSLVPLPGVGAMDIEALAEAKSVPEFLRLLPDGPLRQGLSVAVDFPREVKPPFFFEAAMDQGYFGELLARTATLGDADQALLKPLILQEIDTFHLMLVARGRFIYRLEASSLLPWHIPGTGLPRERLAAMLSDSDLRTAASRALGRALDRVPIPTGPDVGAVNTLEPADLEGLAGNRFLRLANRAFRRSHMGLAAVVAFVELRRVEVANLVTLSEGLRLKLPGEQMLPRLIPRPIAEVSHV